MNQNMTGQPMLNDQDRMEDLLSQEKYLVDAYSTFIPEATCPQLRQVLTDNMNQCLQDSYSIFNQMSQLGWYQTKNAPDDEVNSARSKFADLKNQMA